MIRRSENRRGERGSYSGGAAFGLLSVGVGAFISLASSVATARIYGIDVVGAFALAYAPTAICASLSSMQEQAALARELATTEPRAPRVTGMFAAVQLFSTGLTLLVSLIVGAVAAVLYHGPIDRPELVAPALAILATYVLVDNTSWNLDVIFAAFHAGRDLFVARLAVAVSFLATAVGLSWAIDTVWALALAQIASFATGLLLRLVMVRAFMRFRVERAELRRGVKDLPAIASFGVRLAPAFAAEGVANESGTWILGVTSSVTLVGAWSRAWMLARRLLEPGYRIGEMLLPALVRRRADGDGRGFDATLFDTIRYSTMGLMLPAAAIGGAATGVMQIFGPGFDRGADALALLLLVPVLYGIHNPQLLAQTADGRPWEASRITVVCSAIMIATGFALSHPFGIEGMAAGYVFGHAVDVAWRTTLTRRSLAQPLRVLWPLRSVAAVLGAYAAGLIAGRLVDTALDGIGGTVLALAAASSAYLAVLVAGGGLLTVDRTRLNALADRLPARLSRRPWTKSPLTRHSESR